MKKISLVLIMSLLLFFCGCVSSWEAANQALERSNEVEDSVLSAMFIKSWGLNRALITESREKFITKAKLCVEKISNDSQITTTQAADIIENLHNELGKDEVVISQNFAYLSLLMMLYERANTLEGNVDFYLAANKPIWLGLSEEGHRELDIIKTEINKWTPLVGDLINLLPRSLIPEISTKPS